MSAHYTYIDDNGMEYFVYRLVGGVYGIYCARGRRTPLPYVNDTFKTAEQAQVRLNAIAAEMEWGQK